MDSSKDVMRIDHRKSGTVLILTVFIIAMLSIAVSGMLSAISSDLSLMQNHIDSAEAEMMALAGLNDAFDQIRRDRDWDEGFSNKAFNGGTYSVDVDEDEITVVGTTEKGFSARLVTEVTISPIGPPYTIRQDSL